MKKIPWKGIAIGSLVMVILVVARSVVTVAKAVYYSQDWSAKLVEDPWFVVGIVAALLGVGALLELKTQQKKRASQKKDRQQTHWKKK